MIHIIPIGDIEEHLEETACWCCPTVEEYEGNIICTHNAFDGRTKEEQKPGYTTPEGKGWDVIIE